MKRGTILTVLWDRFRSVSQEKTYARNAVVRQLTHPEEQKEERCGWAVGSDGVAEHANVGAHQEEFVTSFMQLYKDRNHLEAA